MPSSALNSRGISQLIFVFEAENATWISGPFCGLKNLSKLTCLFYYVNCFFKILCSFVGKSRALLVGSVPWVLFLAFCCCVKHYD